MLNPSLQELWKADGSSANLVAPEALPADDGPVSFNLAIGCGGRGLFCGFFANRVAQTGYAFPRAWGYYRTGWANGRRQWSSEPYWASSFQPTAYSYAPTYSGYSTPSYSSYYPYGW